MRNCGSWVNREVVAGLVGALEPGGPDLGTADEDPVGGRVVVGPVGFGDDADVPCLHAQGHDLALKLGIDLLERADVRHGKAPLISVSRPRPSRPRWRSTGRERSTPHSAWSRSAPEDGEAPTPPAN